MLHAYKSFLAGKFVDLNVQFLLKGDYTQKQKLDKEKKEKEEKEKKKEKLTTQSPKLLSNCGIFLERVTQKSY